MFNAATQRLNPFVMVFQVQVDCALESSTFLIFRFDEYSSHGGVGITGIPKRKDIRLG